MNLKRLYLPATVDFPTPPFPEATIRICFTPFIGFLFGSPLSNNSDLEVLNYTVDNKYQNH